LDIIDMIWEKIKANFGKFDKIWAKSKSRISNIRISLGYAGEN